MEKYYKVVVMRHNLYAIPDWFGINIHVDLNHWTFSHLCQSNKSLLLVPSCAVYTCIILVFML